MGSDETLSINLTGGAPWGFRLMGGEGFPLEIAKIRKKSKADVGGLKEGDVILSMNGVSVKGKSHEDAMYIVDTSGEKLTFQIQRGPTKKQQLQPATNLKHHNSNVVSSAASAYTVKEGNQTRNVVTQQFQENTPDGLHANTFIKREEVVNNEPVITGVQCVPTSSTTVTHKRKEVKQQFQEPRQVYVDIKDQNSMKENISPVPNHFQPNSTSTPIPQFKVRNVKGTIKFQKPEVEKPRQAPSEEYPIGYPMFHVSKFHPRIGSGQNVTQFDPVPMPLEQSMLPPPPPPPPIPFQERRYPDNEPIMFPVPKPTFMEVQRMVSYQDEEDDVDGEYGDDDSHHHDHLPIFAPPVAITLEERNMMDSGYDDERLLTPGSVDRPHDLPNLGLIRSYSQDSEHTMPGTPDTGSTAVRRKKKLFADSAFYDDPTTSFPTIEEQIDLCKKIAKSLTSAANRKARGAKMFAKRKRKSTKWVHEGEPSYLGSSSAGDVADLRDLDSELSPTEGGTKPLFTFRIPNIASRITFVEDEDQRMSLTPDEFERLRLDRNRVEHRSVSPGTCHHLVADLQSPRNKGAKLFQKRAARSEKWVIDESNAAKPPTQTRLDNMVHSPVKAPLSPWEAAMDNPIGNVDKAFDHLDSRNKMNQVNWTMKAKQPSSYQPVKVPQTQTAFSKKTTYSLKTDNQPHVITGPNYNRLPRGWNTDGQRHTSTTTTTTYRDVHQPQYQQHFQPPQYHPQIQPQPKFRQEPPPPPPPQKPLKQQENYNRKIQAWGSTPDGNTRTYQSSSHSSRPLSGSYGQPQGYSTTDSYQYQMTSVSDF